MSKKYLPIHHKMIELLAAGMLVVHNGNNGRQGKTGHIRMIAGHQVYINFDDYTSQKYSMDYFSRCFYISTTDIAEMHGNMFHADGFLRKYGEHAKTYLEMKTNQLSHERLKAKVELKVREAKLKVKQEPVTVNAPAQDPLDAEGRYRITKSDGSLIGRATTQRNALTMAGKHTETYREEAVIWKVVAVSSPIVAISADIKFA